MLRTISAGLIAWAMVQSAADAAPVDIFFKGSPSFDPARSAERGRVIPEVDAAVLNTIDGAAVSGRFTLDLGAPVTQGSTDPGARAVYDDASLDFEMAIAGLAFINDDPATCRSSTGSLCFAQQTNDQVFAPGLAPFDSFSIVTDSAASDPLTTAIEAASGASANT